MCTLDNSRMPCKPNNRNPLMKMLAPHITPLILTVKPHTRGNGRHINVIHQSYLHTTAMFRQCSRRKGLQTIHAAP